MHQTKLAKLKELYTSGQQEPALCMAAKFPQLGQHKIAITRGADALKHPDFYRQMGRKPDELVAAGLAALRERYDLA